MTNEQYRQGDVFLRKVSGLPDDAIPQNSDGDRVVLAYGEVTGHAHAIDASLAKLYASGQKNFLHVERDAQLRHEEHTALPLAPGFYEVLLQREYEHQGWRRVSD